MNLIKTLAEVTEFGATVNFREAVKPEPGAAFGIVQAKDVGAGALNISGITYVSKLPMKGEPPLLETNDVLLQSRGTSYRAAIVPDGIPVLAAASSLYVLRAKTKLTDPRYLVLFLNLPTTQAALRKIATGSHILNIRREELASLEVPLPPLPDQRLLVGLGELIHRSFELEQRLHQLRLQELHALITGRAKKAGRAPTLPASKERSAERHQRSQTRS